jgi:hypothetical protein
MITSSVCVALVFRAAEQGAQNRDVRQPREPAIQVAEIVLQKARNREALPVAHFDRGRGLAALEGGDREAVFMERPLDGSIEDTAASIVRLMMSPSTTVGVKFSSTPKGLNSTVIVSLS